MTLAECREIVDMYDGATSSERRQLTALLGRLDEIAADLRRGRPTCGARWPRSTRSPASAATGWPSSPTDRQPSRPQTWSTSFAHCSG